MESSLIDMYAKCGSLDQAQYVLYRDLKQNEGI